MHNDVNYTYLNRRREFEDTCILLRSLLFRLIRGEIRIEYLKLRHG